MLGRRDVLAAFLGTAALDACRRPRQVRSGLEGRLIDDLHDTGHVLREATPLPRAPDARPVEVLIVGAGAAGLSAAWRLRGAGVDDVLLTEVDAEAGGTSQSGRNEVSAFPWGAHYLPAPLTSTGSVPRVLKEMGVLTGVDGDGAPQYAEQTLVREPDERVHYRGQWYDGLYLRAGASAEDLEQLQRFERRMKAFASAVDSRGRKAFAVPLEAGSDDAEFTTLDRLSMAQWMQQEGFTSARLLWLVDYACRDDYGASMAATSAWAGVWYFSSRQSENERSDGYLSWPEGNGALIAHLVRQVGSERLKQRVLIHSVERSERGWRADGLETSTRTPIAFEARQLIMATPRFIAARVLTAWRRERPAFLDAFSYSPWVVANATLERRPRSRGFPLCWDNVLYDSKSLGYVVATHQRERAEETGPTVITWYYPLAEPDAVAQRKRLLDTTWADWRDVLLADLLPAHLDLHDVVTRIDVKRWGHAMVRPTPGFVWGPHRREAAKSLENSLHFAHSDLGGLALFEEANWHGVRAAEAVLSALGRTHASWR